MFAKGSFAAGSAETLVHKCPLCIHTDRKFWALGFVAMCHLRTFASLTKSLLFPKIPSASKVKGRISSSGRFFFGDIVDRAADADSNCL